MGSHHIAAPIISLVLATWLLLLAQVQTASYNYTYVIFEETHTHENLGNLVKELKLHRMMPAEQLERHTIEFFPSEQRGQDYFEVVKLSALSQTLRLKKKIDREAICFSASDTQALCHCSSNPAEGCHLLLNFAVLPLTDYFIFFTLRINITDVNDNAPRFEPSTYEITFSEADPVNTVRQIPNAVDADYGLNSLVTYRLTRYTDKFRLDWSRESPILKLVLRQPLDREQVDQYELEIVARDSGAESRTGQLFVTVKVTDINDETPKFEKALYIVNISEAVPIGSHVVHVVARDSDTGVNSKILYQLDSDSAQSTLRVFGLDSSSGLVTLKGRLDRESVESYRILVIAKDQGSPPKSTTCTVLINVLDVNDNIPEIKISPEVSVRENRPLETVVTTFSVLDSDSKENGSVDCSVETMMSPLSQSLKNNFSVNLIVGVANTYKLMTRVTFDRESLAQQNVTIVCWDYGIPRLQVRKAVHVTIDDDNDHSPVFVRESYSAQVDENNNLGHYLLTVGATDRDIGANGRISYFIYANMSAPGFRIDADSGVIEVMSKLDREANSKLTLRVGARDNGERSMTATASVTVYVEDVNDVAPRINASGLFSVREDLPIGTVVGHLSASDPDLGSGGQTSLYLTENEDFVLFDTGTLATKRIFDREETSSYPVTVYAKDNGNPRLTSSVIVNVFIRDINDWPPEFLFPTIPKTNLTVSFREKKGFLIAQLSATDRDEGSNAIIDYFLEPASNLFDLDQELGKLTTVRDLTGEDLGRYPLTYVARDRGIPPKDASIQVVVFLLDIPAKWQESSAMGQMDNFSVMIILFGVSAILICALTIAIVAVVRRRHGCKSSQFCACCGGGSDASKADSYSSTSTDIHPNSILARQLPTKTAPGNIYSASPSHIPLRIHEEPYMTEQAAQYYQMSSMGVGPGSHSDSGKGGSAESSTVSSFVGGPQHEGMYVKSSSTDRMMRTMGRHGNHYPSTSTSTVSGGTLPRSSNGVGHPHHPNHRVTLSHGAVQGPPGVYPLPPSNGEHAMTHSPSVHSDFYSRSQYQSEIDKESTTPLPPPMPPLHTTTVTFRRPAGVGGRLTSSLETERTQSPGVQSLGPPTINGRRELPEGAVLMDLLDMASRTTVV